MNILILLAEPLPPQQTGGSQTVAFEVARGLAAMGDTIRVAGRLDPRKLSGVPYLLKALLSRKLAVTSRHQGLSVTRFLKERRAIPILMQAFKPDVILLHGMAAVPIAEAVTAANTPLVIYWHDAEDQLLGGTLDRVRASYIANSAFTSAHYERLFDVKSSLIAPIFKELPASGQPTRGEGKGFLFVNPVREKGLDLALTLASLCPEVPFEFLESWEISADRRRFLMSSLGKLPNVKLTPRQADMRPVYERNRVLLMPSLWQEAWGKVVSEAQAFGLPVIARAVGGLSESVGTGGILMRPDASAEEWAAKVRALSEDTALYEELSTQAWNRARRVEVNPHGNLLKLRTVLCQTIETRRAAA